MKEVPVQFGSASSLAGVVTEPTGVPSVACIFITAGLTLRMGPFRLYTTLARNLATEGVVSLRFDLDNIGDSGNGYSQHHLDKRVLSETRDAIDFICQKYGLEKVVLCGLCSGAETAFRCAEDDRRVRGVVMFDPFAYETPGNKWRFHVHRVYRRALRALGLFEPVKYAATGDRAGSGLVQYRYMDYSESHRILSRLIRRNAYVHFVYTGAVRETFNHPSQLRKAFPDLALGHNVQVDWVPDVSHTPVFNHQLEKMTRIVVRKLLSFLAKERLGEGKRELRKGSQMTPRRS